MIYYVRNSIIMLASGPSGLGPRLHRRLYNLVCLTMDCLLYQCVNSCRKCYYKYSVQTMVFIPLSCIS